MIEYKDNETYEKSKAKLFDAITNHNSVSPDCIGIYALRDNLNLAENLLKQSMWAGAVNPIKPIPVVRDGNGTLIKSYSTSDFFTKLDEELNEVKWDAIAMEEVEPDNYFSRKSDRLEDMERRRQEWKLRLAEEIQDLITVCTSWLDALGFDEAARDKICAKVNEKNRKRGYHSSGGKSLNSESEMFYIPVERTVSLSVEDIDNIMTTALVGGINYWCGAAEVVGDCIGKYASEQIARGGTLVLHDAESNDKWELNREKLLKGFKRWFDDDGAQFAPNGQIDWTSFDANDADCIIQYALFGEIVFG